MKVIEDQIKTLEAAHKYLSEHNDGGENDERIKEIEKTLEFLNGQKQDIQTKYDRGFGRATLASLFDITEQDWSEWGLNWEDNLAKMTDRLKSFADDVFELWSAIDSVMQNQMEAELQRNEELYNAKSESMKRQLDNGLISQKKYDAQMEKLQKEKDKKERTLKHEQFEREKTANIIQTVISGALAAAQTLAQWGFPWGLIPMTLSLAATAVQTAVIASQPNPYAHGGVIDKKQYAVMGEEGPEWVAPNRMMRDKKTAPVIAALEEYRKGDTRALERIPFPEPDLKTVSQSVPRTGGNFAPSNQTTNNYYQNREDGEAVRLLRRIEEYQRDPMNRRSYISRRIQLEFEEQEREVREMARL